jgi:hypothetical protein
MHAHEWLAGQGYQPRAGGGWAGPGLDDGSDNDLVHAIADELWYADLPPAAAVDLTLELLEELQDYALLMYLHLAWDGLPETLRDRVLRRYVAVLESDDQGRTAEIEAVEYSIWVDFFEDPRTQEQAFRTLAADLGPGLSIPSAARRLKRLLPLTGPVAWPLKNLLYAALAADPRWAPWVLAGLVASHNDVYGQLDPGEALTLLDQLAVSPSDERLASLRAAVTQGFDDRGRGAR